MFSNSLLWLTFLLIGYLSFPWTTILKHMGGLLFPLKFHWISRTKANDWASNINFKAAACKHRSKLVLFYLPVTIVYLSPLSLYSCTKAKKRKCTQTRTFSISIGELKPDHKLFNVQPITKTTISI